MVDPKKGWKTIAKTNVPADNMSAALATIDKKYKRNQYIHNVILEKPLQIRI